MSDITLIKHVAQSLGIELSDEAANYITAEVVGAELMRMSGGETLRKYFEDFFHAPLIETDDFKKSKD